MRVAFGIEAWQGREGGRQAVRPSRAARRGGVVDVQSVRKLQRRMEAMPVDFQHLIYGEATFAVARGLSNRIRRRYKNEAQGTKLPIYKGRLRPRLWETVKPKRIAWYWPGGAAAVPNSAALVLIKSPHAILVERGRSSGNRGRVPARPIIAREMKNHSVQAGDFRRGFDRAFNRAKGQIESGKVSRKLGRAISGG